MKFHLEKISDVFSELSSKREGLSTEEARSRLEKHGRNKLAEGKHVSLIARFFSQMTDPMVLVLLAAAAVSAATSIMAHESPADVCIILAVVILNAVLGVVQESKAEKAIEALKEMSSATSKVLRDGKITQIQSEELVPGDVVLLEAGDAVPADARIFECASLKLEEAALTGESVPSEKTSDALAADDGKDVPLGDRKNMVYMGSAVVYGRGRAVITNTGMDTEMGKIADAITKAEDGETPLQLKLASLSKILTFLVLGICVFIFAFSLIKEGNFELETVLNTFMLAVSLAVAAIPEGLVAVVTIVLSIGVTKMSKHNAIIRRLTAVETLGCTQIICSDKTGTLTQNKMTVVEYSGDDEVLLASSLALCSDAELGADGQAEGDPTQCAVVNYANKLGYPKYELNNQNPRIGEIPFDSMRKMMTTVHQASDGKVIQHTTGAPDVIISRCSFYYKAGQALPMTDEMRAYFLSENKRLAGKALRVLAASFRMYDRPPVSYDSEALENNLIFIGLVGMIDPVRPEVPAAIAECKSAGIRPIMITGDHKDTASAIAMQLGIITDPSQAITGAEINEMSDEELKQNIERYSVYARVQPEHKVRIVNAWRSKGCITAMTGDGVNDAPSIKSADIGIGMGITGTDVTKNVADMILADDNFATIVKAVGEGRRIYDNICKAINFLLSSNLSEVISIFIATVLGFTILRPIHILWINLITDSLPALALGMEPEEPGLMKRKPRDTKEGVFAHGAGISIFYQGIVVSALTLAAYFIGHFIESGEFIFTGFANGFSPDGMTMAFLTMSMAEIFHAYNMRSQRLSLLKLHTHNVFLFGAMIASLVLTSTVIYIPFLRNIFGFEFIDAGEYFTALALAFLIIPIVELVKFIRNLVEKKRVQS